MKDSYIMHCDYGNHFELLTDAELGRLIRDVNNYVKNGVLPQYTKEDRVLNMAFSFMKTNIDIETEKYIKKCEKNIVALFCCSFFTALKLLFLQFFSCFCIPFSAAVIYASFIAFHACILHFAPFPRPAVAFSALPAPAPPCPLTMLLISSIINTVLRLPLFPHSFFGG